MNIYKLVPQEGGNGDWDRSAYKGEAVIRAASEKDARIIADVSFGIAKLVTPGAKTSLGPWDDKMSVRCDLLKGSNYPEDGKREVLEPKEWKTEITFAPLQ